MPWISHGFLKMRLKISEDIWRYLSRCTGTKPKMPYTFFNLYCFIFNQTSAYVCLIEYWILVLINDDTNIDGNSQRGLWEAEAADATAAARGRSEGFFDFSWRPKGFPMGKSWENHGKTMGKPWDKLSFHSHGGTPVAVWFIRENPHRSKWMITGHIPMT